MTKRLDENLKKGLNSKNMKKFMEEDKGVKKIELDKMNKMLKGKKGLAGGGSLKMVTNDQGQKVPFFAADGKGKMMGGGMVKPKKMMGGGKVKKYGGGGKVRGCGVARKGVKSAKMVTMAGA
tara:strand:- start:309 stop:674 length:366 start_codon:yes stop_codon:yes gene_type:complete